MKRRHLHHLCLMGLGMLLTLSSAFAAPPPTIRVAINHGNAVLAHMDKQTGRLSGVSVDIAQEVGKTLGVAVELIGFGSANESVQAVRSGAADFGFFAIDPERAKGLRFTPAYVVIEGAYAVAQSSCIQTLQDVDRPGTRVVVADKSAYDLYLSRALKEATLIKTARSNEVADLMFSKHYEVAAGVKQQLEQDMQKHPTLRLIEPSFMQIQQAMATQENNIEMHATLLQLLAQMKASGFIRASLKRHQIDGVTIAP